MYPLIILLVMGLVFGFHNLGNFFVLTMLLLISLSFWLDPSQPLFTVRVKRAKCTCRRH